VRFEFAGTTNAVPGDADGRTTLGFLDRPELDRVLGATSFLIDTTNGDIVEADVFFNSRFAWSASPQGSPARVDIESVALHEIGHLLGLGHSALGETELTPAAAGGVSSPAGAVMFPIALTAGAIADSRADRPTTSQAFPICILRPGTSPPPAVSSDASCATARVFTACMSSPSIRVRASWSAASSLNTSGDFVIAGLTPGAYILRAEPLDDADAEAFFSVPIDTDVRAGYGDAIVVAPEGGSSATTEIPRDAQMSARLLVIAWLVRQRRERRPHSPNARRSRLSRITR
jgi:hypothetical protein